MKESPQVITLVFLTGVLFTLLAGCTFRDIADSEYLEGDYEAAIESYNKAIEDNPSFAGAYNNRGAAYHALGNHKQALADYDKAIELEPTVGLYYSNRGVAYQDLGGYEAALADYNKAIDIDPEGLFGQQNPGLPYTNRGAIYIRFERYDEALADLHDAVRIEPSSAIAHARRAVVRVHLGNAEEAEKDTARALALGFNSTDLDAMLKQARGELATTTPP